MPKPIVTVAIVNWNTRDLLRACLASLPWDSPSIDLDVVVADNGSRDGSQGMVRREFPQVRLLRNRANLGFVLATNQALTAGRGDYHLLLNSDTEVLPGAIERLVEVLAARPDVGAVGPRLLNTDGTYQAQLFPFPTLWQRLRPGRHEAAYAAAVEDRVALAPHSPVAVHWLVGAALLTRRDVLRRVGPLDERIFMWYDDVDWGRKLAHAGYRCLFVPDATVRHHVRQSAARLTNRVLAEQMMTSEYTYLRLNDGLTATYLAIGLRLAKALAKLALAGGAAAREEALWRLRFAWRCLRQFAAVPAGVAARRR